MSAYRVFAEKLAYQAGDIVRQNFGFNMKKDWKGDGTPLTATDKAINALIIRAVASSFPDHAVLAEEGNLDKKGAPLLWVCDPLDGTYPFSHGIPTCVVSLALVRNGTPILGVTYCPFKDTKWMFSAEKGQGAYLNGLPTHVSDKTDMANELIGIGYAWNHVNLRDVGHKLVQQKAATVQFASNVYMGSLVANGEFLAVFFSGKLPWDVAALKIIVEEAGGRVTDLFGNEQRYDQEIRGAIISNGRVHDQLVELVHTHVQRLI